MHVEEHTFPQPEWVNGPHYADGKVTKPFQSNDANLIETRHPVTMWVEKSKGTGTSELPPLRVTSTVRIALGVVAFIIGSALCIWSCVLHINVSTAPPSYTH